MTFSTPNFTSDRNPVTARNVTITNCDREQIHIPNSIQPHGVLLVMREADLRIVAISNNSETHLQHSPEAFLDTPLSEWVREADINSIRSCLSGDFEAVNPLLLHFKGCDRPWNGIVHLCQKNVVLELEPAQEQETVDFFRFYKVTKSAVAHLQSARTLQDLCDSVVRDLRRITGFDRVMVYRFDDDGSGNVIAEAKSDRGTPYLGLRYPESDIPKQARRLYALNPLRLVPTIHYEPAELVTSDRDPLKSPLDMSFCVLRSVSPIHVEYLENMGVTASMSISLLDRGQLWGLIACHHETPKYVSYQMRTVCEFLGQVTSMQLATKLEKENLNERLRVKQAQSQLLEQVSHIEDIRRELPQLEPLLLQAFQATGVAFYRDGEVTLMGETPPAEVVENIVTWVEPHLEDSLFVSHQLPEAYEAMREYKDVASGVMVLSVTQSQRNYLLWFRPEVVKNVNWAGNPNKRKTIEEDGSISLSPRESFEKWQETVRFQSHPWKFYEKEGALELRNTLVSIVLKKAAELAELNLELERSNNELDAFAYIASHDLKEPLRGIHNYSTFLIEDYKNLLDEEGVSKLETLVRLTQRMEDLINALLHFSRLGRQEIQRSPIDVMELVRNVEEVIRISHSSSEFRLEIPRSLPQVMGDRVLLEEVLMNLITNGLKYNTQPQKVLTVGYFDNLENLDELTLPNRVRISTEDLPIFYIRDNGIGIRERHIESVFKIFKRLHGRDRFGGGTGAGLTIVKKIIERHGGQIWLDSHYGSGSTFYFTLGSSQPTSSI